MSRIYNAIRALLIEWSSSPARDTDEWPGLSARDWADLPPYHPAERGARSRR